MKSQRLQTIAIAALFLLLYLAPLEFRPLMIPDEARYSQIPREMLQKGEWLSPRFDGMKYFEKPSAGYWPVMLSMKAFGESHFAARLPQALAAGLTALLVWLLVRRSGKDESLPFWAALVQLLFAEPFLVGTFSVLDGVLTLFTTGAMCMFYHAWTEKAFAKRQGFLLLSGVFCGLAFMTKGLIGLAIPGAAIAAFLIWMRDWKAFYRMPWTPLLGAAATATPWAVMQHLREPEFWKYFIMVEHFGRFAGEGAERHPQPFWFYIPVVIGGLTPFTAFAYTAARGGMRLDWKSPFLRFAAAWAIVPAILLSLSGGKLGTYILPIFPPLAALAAFSLFEAFKDGRAKSFGIAAQVLAGICAVAALALTALQLSGCEKVCLYGNGETYKWLLAAMSLAFMSGMLWLSANVAKAKHKMALLCASPLLLMLCWHMAFPERIATQKAPEDFIAGCAKRIAPDTMLVCNSDLVGIVCWVLKRDDVILFRKTGEFDYGVKESKDERRFLDVDEFKRLVLEKGASKRVALFIPSRLIKRCVEDLKPLESESNGFYSLLVF